jgi:hypothetical protein
MSGRGPANMNRDARNSFRRAGDLILLVLRCVKRNKISDGKNRLSSLDYFEERKGWPLAGPALRNNDEMLQRSAIFESSTFALMPSKIVPEQMLAASRQDCAAAEASPFIERIAPM